MSQNHEALMLRAVELSKTGYPAPNPPVGCVIFKNGQIVAEGYPTFFGGPHAEAVALAAAGDTAKDATVYVTLEPCSHHGKTPPCADALIKAGVKEVFVAVRDPNPQAAGGVEKMREAGIKVECGLCQVEAARENYPFLFAMKAKRPYVNLKMASTLDGFAARLDGTSKWITSEKARSSGHLRRAKMGSVLVGAGTVLQDDPELTARVEGVVRQPLKVILDPMGKLSGHEKCLQENFLWYVGEPHADKATQTRMPLTDGVFDLALILDDLYKRGVVGVLVEGGPTVARSFLKSGLAERIDAFWGPVVFGSGQSWFGGEELDLRSLGWELESAGTLDQDFFAIYSQEKRVLGTIFEGALSQ